jgi:hypothetical protein
MPVLVLTRLDLAFDSGLDTGRVSDQVTPTITLSQPVERGSLSAGAPPTALGIDWGAKGGGM